jgi:hypothetical protein
LGNIAGSTLLLYVQGVIIAGLFVFALHQIDQTLVRSWRLLRWLVDQPKRARGRKMIRRARKMGQCAVYNSENRTTSFTSLDQFNDTLQWMTNEHYRNFGGVNWSEVEMLDKYSEIRNNWRKALTTRIKVAPVTIYSFAEDSGVQTFGHTGRIEQLDRLAEELVEIKTGIKPSAVYDKDFRTAQNILVRRDHRLLVPFADAGKSLSDEQIRRYGGLSAENILQFVAPRLSRPKY